MKRHIPNLVTLLNLFCGAVAVIFAVHNNFVTAAVFVFLGIFFDFFDGLLARKLNVQSEIGLQLDSLADMVTSGLVPGIIMFKLLALSMSSSGFYEPTRDWTSAMHWYDLNVSPFAFFGLLVTLASGYRLAKFNVDEDQQTYFKGLPTPANALLIISLPLIMEFQNHSFLNAVILNPWFLLVLTVVSSYLLVCNLKLFALKFKDWSFKNNSVRYVFIIISAVLLIALQFAAIPLIIALYILVSLFTK